MTPWTVAHQAPLSMGFSRQEYWSRLPFTTPGDLPHPGIKPGSPALQAVSLTESQRKAIYIIKQIVAPILCLVAQSCPIFCDPMDCSPPGSFVQGDSPGKNPGVGCHAFLQGIFPTQGLKLGLALCRQIFYHLSHQGNPGTLELVGYYFSRVFSEARNRTGVSCIAGGFFYQLSYQGSP